MRSFNLRSSARNPKLFVLKKDGYHTVKITPTPISAAIAGAFTGIVMPILWAHFGNDTMSLVVAFLLVVVLPAHAFVVGFSYSQTANARSLDTALIKRVGAWLGAIAIAMAVAQAFRA